MALGRMFVLVWDGDCEARWRVLLGLLFIVPDPWASLALVLEGFRPFDWCLMLDWDLRI